MFQPGKWLFDLFRYGGFALIVGGVFAVLTSGQGGEPMSGDGFALVLLGGLFLIISMRLKERRSARDKTDN